TSTSIATSTSTTSIAAVATTGHTIQRIARVGGTTTPTSRKNSAVIATPSPVARKIVSASEAAEANRIRQQAEGKRNGPIVLEAATTGRTSAAGATGQVVALGPIDQAAAEAALLGATDQAVALGPIDQAAAEAALLGATDQAVPAIGRAAGA